MCYKSRNIMEDLQALNNCEIFNQIRTELTKYQQENRKFSSFAFLSGNVENIKDMAKGIVSVLLEHGLVQQEEHSPDEQLLRLVCKPTPGANADQLRGTLMYLVLNSANVGSNQDAEQSELGQSNPQCVHLLNQLPEPLPPLLTVTLALNCGLEQQLLEFLACGPYWLTSQYYDCFSDAVSHLIKNRFVSLPLIGGALSAVTKAICYYDQPGQGSPGVQATPIGNAVQLLQRHILEAETKLPPGSRSHQRYLGQAIHQLLDNVLESMRALKERPAQPSYFEVYALHAPYRVPLIKTETKQAGDGHEMLRNFAVKMMDAVERLVMSVSIDAYMLWHDLPSGQLLFNLQGHINNLSKQLLDLLTQEDENLQKHSLRVSLLNFAEGAQSFEQRLESLSLGELLGFLDGEMGAVNDAQLLAGHEQLQQRPIAFSNDECVEAMAKHVHLLQPVHAEVIMQHLAQFMCAKQEVKQENTQPEDDQDDEVESDNYLYADLLRQVLMPIFQACTQAHVKLELLETRDKLKLVDYYNFEQENSSSRRIYFFNQLSFNIHRFPLLEFLDLCYEQPSETWLALAQLGMSQKDYTKLYFHVAVQCTHHAKHYVAYTVSQLMLDERLLCQSLYPTNSDLLLKLYEHPVILNGMNYRQTVKTRPPRAGRSVRTYTVSSLCLNISDDTLAYTSAQLQAAQNDYLESLAAGIDKFVELGNYVAVERLLQTLLKLESVEDRLNKCSRMGVRSYRNLVKTPDAGEQAVKSFKLAKEYTKMNAKLTAWRINNWTLVAQVVRSMDSLRAGPAEYDDSRMLVLDRLVDYFTISVQNSCFLYPDLRQKLRQLTNNLQHKDMWTDGQLTMLLSGNPEQTKECATLLAMASSMEAIKLFQESIRYGIDGELMKGLSTAVDLINTSNSLKAYIFYFRIYMRVYRTSFISQANAYDYNYLAEHLLQTPRVLKPEFFTSAVENLSILLNVSKKTVLLIGFKFADLEN